MLRKLFFISLNLVAVFGFAQVTPLKQKIDSINQKKWDSTLVNLDSLDIPKNVAINIKKKDTIILKEPDRGVQEEPPITPFRMMHTYRERQWFFYGQNTLNFNQSSFSNWNSGGNNSIGVIGRINYSLSYKSGRHFWDSNVKMGYGMITMSEYGLRKTEDFMNIASNYGYELGKEYYLSAGFQFLSQFSAGYNYSSTTKTTFEDRISRFMAPAYLYAGIGVLYNPNENFQVVVRPINTKMTFVLDKKLQTAGRYGMDRDGQSLRMELGAMVNAAYRIKIYKDISFINQLTLFSSYSSHPERIDIIYSGILNMRFNRWISTTLNVDVVYDHDQVEKVQIKQVLGVGVSYNLGIANKPKHEKREKFNPFFR